MYIYIYICIMFTGFHIIAIRECSEYNVPTFELNYNGSFGFILKFIRMKKKKFFESFRFKLTSLPRSFTSIRIL